MNYLQCEDKQAGITLVELIVSIVVVAVAVSGVLFAVQFATRQSGDPMIRQQAVAIADAYMEEILLKSYEDPDGGETGGAESGESRPTYDDVYDYNTIKDERPRDQRNLDMPGLKNYRVSVGVEKVKDELGPAGGLGESARIRVRVEHLFTDVKFSLTGYKARY